MTSKEALNKLKHHIDGTELKGSEILECYKIISKDLDRLKAIDNAKPSEALDRLEYICKILGEKRIDIKWLFKEDYNIIKNALLKVQKQEYIDRRIADLAETIGCFKQHAFIKKNSKIGTEILVTLHSNDEDFKKVSWVFDIVK